MKAGDDPVIGRIREIRRRISEKHNHDPQRLVEYYIKLQGQYEKRLLVDSELESAHAVQTPPTREQLEPVSAVGEGKMIYSANTEDTPGSTHGVSRQG